MNATIDAIRADYIRELKKEMPKLKKWLKAAEKVNEGKGYPGKIELDFEGRWPTGLAGHPRVIEIFRRYYLKLEAEHGEVVKPVEILIDDLKGEHDDLHKIVRRLRMIPIGIAGGEVF